MEKLICVIFILATVILFSGCQEPEHDFVFIQNDTASELLVTALFSSDLSSSNSVKLTLAPQQRDGWRYAVGSDGLNAPDSKLVKLLLINEFCKTELNRSQLRQVIDRNGAWLLVVTAELMACDG